MIAGLVRCSLLAAILGVATPALLALPPAGRGDVNGDGFITNADITYLVNYFFADGPAPARTCSSDVDANGTSDLRDVFYLINFIHDDGAPPAQVAEVCNGADEDCDGVIDNGVQTTFYRDFDGDSFGDPAMTQQACSVPTGYVLDHTDCNDQNAAIHPGATELCNNADDNCNAQIDEGAAASCAPGDPVCQTGPVCTNGTCTYTNVDAGTTTCGNGVCQITQNKCVNGLPHTCIPNFGAASPETCNGVDDNCDGTVDNGNFSDAYEPNPDCGSVRTLTAVGSDQSNTYTAMTIYAYGDYDYYAIPANETDNACYCGFPFTDEDYKFSATLTVPAGAGSYEFCMKANACDFPAGNCFQVAAGSSFTLEQFLDGACPGVDNYTVYLRVRGVNAPGFSCKPYSLSYTFDAGYCLN
jgi:hypothetical protein